MVVVTIVAVIVAIMTMFLVPMMITMPPPDSLTFEWVESPFSRYTIRIVGPKGVVLERINRDRSGVEK